ncbi:hypothetical protein [Veillonella sp.]|uniref:hypothetical protein n=1 Tax=Veillonella sp. TaxID=1926307 RepID=UPI00290B1B18|nr:hypothetical protein [Veillonella sp.]MDU4008675.1 hypothetical protein [Veillonella sp.]
MINKEQIKQQREAIDSLYELVKNAPASERKDTAMAYCEGCIAACDLGLKVLNGKKTEAPKVEEPVEDIPTAVEEQPTEKPKRKRTSKKKAPVEETLPIEETPEEDDLDDLL